MGGAARADGPGIALGDRLLLHVGIGLEFLYDSNVFYEATNPHQAAALTLTPNVALTTRTARDGAGELVDFRFNAGLGYVEYLSGDTSLTSHRQFNISAGTAATFLPRGQFQITLFDTYARTTEPPYTELPYNLDRDVNELGLRLHYGPGTGRLTIDLTYAFGIDFWEESVLRDFDNIYHRLQLRVAWRFLPKTSAYIEADEQIYSYVNHDTAGFDHPNSFPLHIEAGIQGLVTPKLTINAYAGYDNGFYTSGPSPNTGFGGVSAVWQPTLSTTLSVGYHHDFANSLLGSYYNIDGVFAGWGQHVWRLNTSLRFEYQNQKYEGITVATAVNPLDRTDNLVMLNAKIELPVRPWLIPGIGYDFWYNTSNASLDLGPAGIVPVNYIKHQVWARILFQY